ncbi:hypothetical protein EDD22DRAFT_912790, partial [Suillus occidentalis]
MRSSFFAIIVALTASMMSVSACNCVHSLLPCNNDSDCCDPLDTCYKIVSRSSLLCIKFSLDDLPFAPRNNSQLVPKSAIMKVIT